MGTDFATYGYALLVTSGGVMGYVKAGSLPSLGMGLMFGALIGIGAYQTSQDPRNYHLAFGTSAALAAFMGKRFLDSGKLMPAGLICGISLLMVARFGARALGLAPVKND